MIFSFETLCTGVQILCRLALSPHTPPLTHGALQAALRWATDRQIVGGQSARGFGWCRAEVIHMQNVPDVQFASAYEAYLAERREELLQGLVDGTLCSGVEVLS